MTQPLFYSSIKSGIDSKGRSAMPVDFREAFASTEKLEMQSRLYLVRRELADMPLHLACFGRQLMENLAGDLDYCEADRAFAIETILASTDMVRFDNAGRFSLGAETLKAMGLSDNVLFVGAGRFFELWHPDHVAEAKSALMSSYRATLRSVMVRKIAEGGS